MREMQKAGANKNLVVSSSNGAGGGGNNNNEVSLNNNNEDALVNQNEQMLKAMKNNGTVLDDLESGWDFVKPTEPPEVAKWMEYNEISSLKLRSEVL